MTRVKIQYPSVDDCRRWLLDKSIDAVLIGGYDGSTGYGACFFDRKGRFYDGYRIYTSRVKSYNAHTRILETKNSKYLLVMPEKQP